MYPIQLALLSAEALVMATLVLGTFPQPHGARPLAPVHRAGRLPVPRSLAQPARRGRTGLVDLPGVDGDVHGDAARGAARLHQGRHDRGAQARLRAGARQLRPDAGGAHRQRAPAASPAAPCPAVSAPLAPGQRLGRRGRHHAAAARRHRHHPGLRVREPLRAAAVLAARFLALLLVVSFDNAWFTLLVQGPTNPQFQSLLLAGFVGKATAALLLHRRRCASTCASSSRSGPRSAAATSRTCSRR